MSGSTALTQPTNTQSSLNMAQVQTDISKELLNKTYDAMSNNYREAIRLLNEKDKTTSTQYDLALERSDKIESMTEDLQTSKIKEETFKRRIQYLSDDTIKFYRPIKILRLMGIIFMSLLILTFSYMFFESNGKSIREATLYSFLILVLIFVIRQVGLFYWYRFQN
jgi:hypothetical protein